MSKKKEPVLEKKKFFIVNTSTFKTDICFFINYTEEEMIAKAKQNNKPLYELFQKYFKDKEKNIDDSSDQARMYPLERGYAVRLKFYKDSWRWNVSLASHEICHIVGWLLGKVRTPLCQDTDEVYAYLTEEITLKFLKGWY